MSKLRAHVGTINSPEGLDISVSEAIEFYFPQCVQKIKIEEDAEDGRE